MPHSPHHLSTVPTSLPLTRCAVSTLFFINGMVLASWVPHIPAVKARHAITDGKLGLLLLSMAVGSVIALPLAGWLVSRYSSRRVSITAALGFCLTLPLLLLSPHIGLLASALLLFGACNSILDVAMNAQAVDVERYYGRPIMSSFHGLFSLGGLIGASVAGTVMSLGVGDIPHVTSVTLFAVLAIITVLRWLIASSPQLSERTPTFVTPTRLLLGLGLLAFLGLLSEGAMADWSAVYLHDVLHTDSPTAAAGYAACSLMMAVGRFGGDWLAKRFHPGRLLQVSATLAAVGLGGGLLMGTAPIAIIGFGLVGLGIANIIPVLFSAAGRVQGMQTSTALAAVASTGYLGLLAGPPFIGLVAELSTLPVALGLVSVCCAFIAIGANMVLHSQQFLSDTAGVSTSTLAVRS